MENKKKYYIARDESGKLFFYVGKPKKTAFGIWQHTLSKCCEIDSSMFPDVKWNDEEPTPILIQQAVFKSKE